MGPLLRRIVLVLGWLSLIATLALLSPGVVATAHAGDPVQSAGPSCPIRERSDEQQVIQLERMLEQLRAQVAERQDGRGGVVSLNTRGYNYGIPAVPQEREHPTR